MKILYVFLSLFLPFAHSLECNHKLLQYPIDRRYHTTNQVSTDGEIFNIHLLPHTHNDPGWLKTVDEYYYGSNRHNSSAGVQYILDNVITELLKDPQRQFTYVEQSFFQRWWYEQTNETKAIVRQLVAEGRFDVSVNGGWVMHDEATTHYTAMIDQMTLGHHYLLQEFNLIPTIGWQIDPFGHSVTHSNYLLANDGYLAYYLNRIDYDDFKLRKQSRNLEFIWKGNPSDSDNAIFTGILPFHYSPPKGVSFEATNNPIRDDPSLRDWDVCARIESLIANLWEFMNATQGHHLLVTMGDDFNYQNARIWFKNMDKLMHYFNQLSSQHHMHLLYSNLTYYTNSKLKENLEFTVKTDDFFPYADAPHQYWTGYFTSRPTVKRYARQANSFLQAAHQFFALRHFHDTSNTLDCPCQSLLKLSKAVALVQHHDAITGTEKQYVSDDYVSRLYDGIQAVEPVLQRLISHLPEVRTDLKPFEFCWMRNVSICNITQNYQNFNVFLYNPLPFQRWISIVVPLNESATELVDPKSGVKLVEATDEFIYDIAPSFPIQSSKSSASKSMLLISCLVDGLAYRLLHIHTRAAATTNPLQQSLVETDEIILENNKLKLLLSKTTGRLIKLVQKSTQIEMRVTTELLYYPTYVGNGQQSGAYIFRPGSTSALPLEGETSLLYVDTKGTYQQARFQIGSFGSLAYILEPNDEYVKLEWTVGPIPITKDIGKEVILRMHTEIQSKDTFYTDANGLAFIERRKNARPSYKVNLTEPIAGNYYPITTGTYLKDNTTQLNIVTDRAQGCASLNSGELEIMLHRRLVCDDGKGVNENLNETETYGKNHTIGLIARGNVYFQLDSIATGVESLRRKMDEIFYEPLVAFQGTDDFSPSRPTTSVPMNLTLPLNVHLVTLQVLSPHCLLVRFLHRFAINESLKYSQPILIDLETVFQTFGRIQKLEEVSLTANRVLHALERPNSTFKITLHPMQFATFKITFEKK